MKLQYQNLYGENKLGPNLFASFISFLGVVATLRVSNLLAQIYDMYRNVGFPDSVFPFKIVMVDVSGISMSVVVIFSIFLSKKQTWIVASYAIVIIPIILGGYWLLAINGVRALGLTH